MRFIPSVIISFFAFQVFSQAQPKVDFQSIALDIIPNLENREISGKGTYFFELLAETDSIFLDAMNMDFSEVKLNDKPINYSNSEKRIGFKAPKKIGAHELQLRYTTKPKQTVYFIEGDDLSHFDCAQCDKPQVWTQGQGKYTSHWLPSFDNMNEKAEFDLTIRIPLEYTAIANGRLIDTQTDGNSKSWEFDMTHPMSSYLAAFVIGDFDKKVVHSKSGVPIELYYEPKDSIKFEPTYRYTKEIFDFLEKEIGVAYPWQNYKQVPVQDFLYAGMENTTCTIFSNQYVIDSTAFADKNYVNVNAHELAHQWFGNLVTEQSGDHHWLHEGFATYYAYLAEKELFGEDYFYWKLFGTARTLHNLSENGDGEALTDPNANSLTFYEKGAWALVLLRDRVGDEAFEQGIKNYLNKYAFGNVTIGIFLGEIEKTSDQSLDAFKTKWLENEEFPWDEVKSYLERNNSIKNYFVIKELNREAAEKGEEDWMSWIWNDSAPEELKRQYLFDYIEKIPDSIVSRVIKEEPLRVRQVVAMALPDVSKNLQSPFETMLHDKSYVTQEAALFKLWQAFPEKRAEYLNQLQNVVGLPNKNVRLLWLSLTLLTDEYLPEQKKTFYDELNGYTDARHNFEVRQLAFQYLYQIGALDDDSLKNLLEASNHHVWQFKKSSRNLIRKFNKSEIGKKRLSLLKKSLTEAQNETLDAILNP